MQQLRRNRNEKKINRLCERRFAVGRASQVSLVIETSLSGEIEGRLLDPPFCGQQNPHKQDFFFFDNKIDTKLMSWQMKVDGDSTFLIVIVLFRENF